MQKLTLNEVSKHPDFQGDRKGLLEVRAGIEPTFADLQSATSPFCHRTSGRQALYRLSEAFGQERYFNQEDDFSSWNEQAIKI